MRTLQTKAVVKRIRERPEESLVALAGRDGYFKVRDDDLKAKLSAACDNASEISVTYDQDLLIIAVD